MIRVVIGSAKTSSAEELRWEEIEVEELTALAETASLLGDTKTYLLRGVLNSERSEELLALSKRFVDSSHLFIFEEEKLLKGPTMLLEKVGASIEIQKIKGEKKERGFDPLGVTSALAARDRKRLWLGLSAALRAGEKPEALAGLLAWKARQMKSVELSRALTILYHDSHRGAGDLELLLERFVLLL